jgi:hypothetical protein
MSDKNNNQHQVNCCANCNNLEKEYDTNGGYCKLLITNTGNWCKDRENASVDCDEVCDNYD